MNILGKNKERGQVFIDCPQTVGNAGLRSLQFLLLNKKDAALNHFYLTMNDFYSTSSDFIPVLNKFYSILNIFCSMLSKFYSMLNEFCSTSCKFYQKLCKFCPITNEFYSKLYKFDSTLNKFCPISNDFCSMLSEFNSTLHQKDSKHPKNLCPEPKEGRKNEYAEKREAVRKEFRMKNKGANLVFAQIYCRGLIYQTLYCNPDFIPLYLPVPCGKKWD